MVAIALRLVHPIPQKQPKSNLQTCRRQPKLFVLLKKKRAKNKTRKTEAQTKSVKVAKGNGIRPPSIRKKEKNEQKSERHNRKKGATKSRWMMMSWVRTRLMGLG